jgi:hypothetical protein
VGEGGSGSLSQVGAGISCPNCYQLPALSEMYRRIQSCLFFMPLKQC